jgi:hypothetical protein
MYGGEERCILFWWGNLRERDHLEDIGIYQKIIWGWGMTGLIWLRRGTGGRFL